MTLSVIFADTEILLTLLKMMPFVFKTSTFSDIVKDKHLTLFEKLVPLADH